MTSSSNKVKLKTNVFIKLKNNVFIFYQLQWKPLNVITLVQGQTDNINQMITIAESKVFPEKMKRKELLSLSLLSSVM